MATAESGSNKQGFGKVLQKKVTRTKEKVSVRYHMPTGQIFRIGTVLYAEGL